MLPRNVITSYHVVLAYSIIPDMNMVNVSLLLSSPFYTVVVAMLAVSRLSATLVQTEISQNLLDGLTSNFVQTSMVPRG